MMIVQAEVYAKSNSSRRSKSSKRSLQSPHSLSKLSSDNSLMSVKGQRLLVWRLKSVRMNLSTLVTILKIFLITRSWLFYTQKKICKRKIPPNYFFSRYGSQQFHSISRKFKISDIQPFYFVGILTGPGMHTSIIVVWDP